ncbi:MAG: hypothetical protein KDA60_09665, partial [Planctomycetales bacterium]|nr:hypothetical protein [Planctomycetales bacterium]
VWLGPDTGKDPTEPDPQTGYGRVDALAAAMALGFQTQGSQQGSPPAPEVSGLDLLTRLGATNVLTMSDSILRDVFSGTATNESLVTFDLVVAPEDVATIDGSFSFEMEKTVLGAMDTLDFVGGIEAELRPEARLSLGYDSEGFFLASDSYLGGEIKASPRVTAALDPFGVALDGVIELSPRLTFDLDVNDPDEGRIRSSEILTHVLGGGNNDGRPDLRIQLQPLDDNSPTSIRATIDASAELGFFDYVDVEPAKPNTENGGDPFVIRGSATLEVDWPEFDLANLDDVSFEFTELELFNPDVNQDGFVDYTPAVFLANAQAFGTELIAELGLQDYLGNVFGNRVDDILPDFVELPRFLIDIEAEPSPNEVATRDQIDAYLTAQVDGEVDPGVIRGHLANWLRSPSASASGVGGGTGGTGVVTIQSLIASAATDQDVTMAAQELLAWENLVLAQGEDIENVIAPVEYEQIKDEFAIRYNSLINAHLTECAPVQHANLTREAFLDHIRSALGLAMDARFVGIPAFTPARVVQALLENGCVVADWIMPPRIEAPSGRIGKDEQLVVIAEAGIRFQEQLVPVDENFAIELTPGDGASYALIESPEGTFDELGRYTTKVGLGALSSQVELTARMGFRVSSQVDSETEVFYFGPSTASNGVIGEPALTLTAPANANSNSLLPLSVFGVGDENEAGVTITSEVIPFRSSQPITLEVLVQAGYGELYDIPVAFSLHGPDGVDLGSLSATGVTISARGTARVTYTPPSTPLTEPIAIGAFALVENQQVFNVIRVIAIDDEVARSQLDTGTTVGNQTKSDAQRNFELYLLATLENSVEITDQHRQLLTPHLRTWLADLLLTDGIIGRVAPTESPAETEVSAAVHEFLQWKSMVDWLGYVESPSPSNQTLAQEWVLSGVASAIDRYVGLIHPHHTTYEEGMGPINQALAWARTAETLGIARSALDDQGLSVAGLIERIGLEVKYNRTQPPTLTGSAQDATLFVDAWLLLRNPDTGESSEVWFPAPVHVNVRPLGSTSVDAEVGWTAFRPHFDPATQSILFEEAGPFTTKVHIGEHDPKARVEVTVGLLGVPLPTRSFNFGNNLLAQEILELAALPEIQVTARDLADSAEPLQECVIDVPEDVDRLLVRVRVTRNGVVASRESVRFQVTGKGGILGGVEEGRTNAEGIVEFTYVAPRSDTPGTAAITALILSEEATQSDSLIINYPSRDTGYAAVPSKYFTPEQDFHTRIIADAVGQTRVDANLSDEFNAAAVAAAHAQISQSLHEWFHSDVNASLGVRSVMTRLIDLQAGNNVDVQSLLPDDFEPLPFDADDGDQQFRDALDQAIGSWMSWLAAEGVARQTVTNVEINDPFAITETDIQSATQLLVGALRHAVTRANLVCAEVAQRTPFVFADVQAAGHMVHEIAHQATFLGVADEANGLLPGLATPLCYQVVIQGTDLQPIASAPGVPATVDARLIVTAGVQVEGVNEPDGTPRFFPVPGIIVGAQGTNGTRLSAVGGTRTDPQGRVVYDVRFGEEADAVRAVIEAGVLDAVPVATAEVALGAEGFSGSLAPRIQVDATIDRIRPDASDYFDPIASNGEPVAIDIQLHGGTGTLAHRAVYVQLFGQGDMPTGEFITDANGAVRLTFIPPPSPGLARIVVGYAYDDQLITERIDVQHGGELTPVGLRTPSEARATAEGRAQTHLASVSRLAQLGSEVDGVDFELLHSIQRDWLLGTPATNLPCGLVCQANEAASVDDGEFILEEYLVWQRQNQHVSAAFDVEVQTHLAPALAGMLERLTVDALAAAQAGKGDAAILLVRLATRIEKLGLTIDAAHSARAIRNNLQLEISFPEEQVVLAGTAESSSLTVEPHVSVGGRSVQLSLPLDVQIIPLGRGSVHDQPYAMPYNAEYIGEPLVIPTRLGPGDTALRVRVSAIDELAPVIGENSEVSRLLVGAFSMSAGVRDRDDPDALLVDAFQVTPGVTPRIEAGVRLGRGPLRDVLAVFRIVEGAGELEDSEGTRGQSITDNAAIFRVPVGSAGETTVEVSYFARPNPFSDHREWVRQRVTILYTDNVGGGGGGVALGEPTGTNDGPSDFFGGLSSLFDSIQVPLTDGSVPMSDVLGLGDGLGFQP